MLTAVVLGAGQEVAASACEALGALVQGTVGFGLNVVAAPLLLLIDPSYVPVPALMAGSLTTFGVAAREWRSLDRASITWALMGRVPGTVAGAAAVLLLARRPLELLFGALILGGVALSVAGWQIRRRPATLLSVGMLSGFMGTTASVGGPPLALVYQRERGSTVRATLSAYGCVGAVLSLVTLAGAGKVTVGAGELTLTLLPGLAVGYLASRVAAPRVDHRWIRPAVLVVVVASAVAVIIRSVG